MASHRPATSAMVLFWSNAGYIRGDVCAAPAAENAPWDTLPAAFWDRGTSSCSGGPTWDCPAPVQFCRMEPAKTSNTLSRGYVGVEGMLHQHAQF